MIIEVDLKLVHSKLSDKDLEGVSLNFGEYAYKLYENSKFVGLVDYEEYDYETVIIKGLWIKPKFRNRGYGKLIVDMLKDEYVGYTIEGCAIDDDSMYFWECVGAEFDSCEDSCYMFNECDGIKEDCAYGNAYDYCFVINC